MNSETPNCWELLAEELAPETLQHLTGGTNVVGTTPHDLVTAVNRSEPYDVADPEED